MSESVDQPTHDDMRPSPSQHHARRDAALSPSQLAYTRTGSLSPSEKPGGSSAKRPDAPVPPNPTALHPNYTLDRFRKRSFLGVPDADAGHADAPGKHGACPAPKKNYPSLVQRRGNSALAKAPNLYIDASADTTPPQTSASRHVSDPPRTGHRPASVRSAPPQQLAFGAESRLPPPSHLLRARDREVSGRSSGDAVADADMRRTAAPYNSTAQDPYAHMPPSAGTPRLFVQHPSTLPSPAYHTSHFGSNVAHAYSDNHSPGAERTQAEAAWPREPLDGPPPRSPVGNKMQFLSLFSDFFDSLSDSRTLKTNLEYQIKSSNALLHTLQRSSKVFEETVERRIRQETRTWESLTAKVEKRLDDMDARLQSLADRLDASAAEPVRAERGDGGARSAPYAN
ncbi:hypothetical protein MSPP1_000850 [Malassezia sp. CBS 17886]|nr:hypothetical protein MSPP1_000850 [Malassezia sp. CBS 17886]